MSDLLRRNAALKDTDTRYRGKSFRWGKRDCGVMFRTHLAAMGHEVKAPVFYKDARGAKRALKALGFDTVEQWVDSLLERIPAARALPGDIMLARGAAGLDGIAVCLGEKVLGWNEQAPLAQSLVLREVIGAWRA